MGMNDGKKHFGPAATTLATTFAVSLAAAPVGAADNPFAAVAFERGYMVAGEHAEGACGGGSGAGGKSGEGACGGGKSGEGACGGAKSGEGACGGEKSGDAKAGEGGCGGKGAEGKCGS
jgi:uncharacterized low-complexity protein